MSKRGVPPKLEPCPDCPIPPRFVLSFLPDETGHIGTCGVECRECGDKWTESLIEE